MNGMHNATSKTQDRVIRESVKCVCVCVCVSLCVKDKEREKERESRVQRECA